MYLYYLRFGIILYDVRVSAYALYPVGGVDASDCSGLVDARTVAS